MDLSSEIAGAKRALEQGDVIAYPTEYCFGLGCDPRNKVAVERLLKIKRRPPEQGVILIAADLDQVKEYADLETLPDLETVTSSWPGPNTWLLPVLPNVPSYICGAHTTIAMRIPEHDFCLKLLKEYGHPIVSTSANRSGESEHLDAASVERDMGAECDYIVHASVGQAKQASTIRNALTGQVLR